MSLDDVFDELDETKSTEKKNKQQPPVKEPEPEPEPDEILEDPEDREPTPEESTPVESSSEEDLWGESTPTTPVKPKPEPEVKVEEIPSKPELETELPVKIDEVLPTKPPGLKPSPLSKPPEKPKYDTSPDSGSPKRVYTIYGLKGEGKTGLSLSFPGTITALSFDRKTSQVWEEMFQKNQRITVYDAIRYLDKSSGEMWLKTADVTFDYINLLLDTEIAKQQPDWILIDGAEMFAQLCEMIMRYRNGLQPFQGVANRNVWKERRMYIDQLHNKCIAIAKKGVIYTTYITKDRIIKDGQIIIEKDVPKWIDAFMVYTDVVIRVRSKQGEKGREFTAEVDSSKTSKIKTGAHIDITGTEGYKHLLGETQT